ncbi:hypothetical protein C4B63_133g23 [Trypanosoma cruzi]|uniref:Uncharacterized protein n=1 Tax=Trypanosoma cruzi TaxID=5693 RepID=A0A2V2UPX0_TRYCR|nr:hypothetical protein C4B63_133g23 [Trypanosoma cruzi]
MGCGNVPVGKAKDLSGEHLKNRTEVRSDCWPCARKSTFVLEREELSVCGKRDVDEDDIRKPVINLSSTSEAVKAVVAFESPRIPVEAEEHLFLVPNVGDKKEARESESSSSYIWRCRVCDKVKPLAGQHLNGKTEVRSDCWPCAAKRTFYRTATQNKFTAKPPAGSPFKSVFWSTVFDCCKATRGVSFQGRVWSTVSTAAKPPAESPFKGVFGAPSSTAAKPPAESPFKSVFGAPSSRSHPRSLLSRTRLEHRLRLLRSHPRSLLSRTCLGHRLRLLQSHPRSLLSRACLEHRLRLMQSHPRS